MPLIYLSFGSNVGNRKSNILQAIKSCVTSEMKMLQISHFYETSAWGNKAQNDFINLCGYFETNLEPLELLKFIKCVENQVGRKKREKWGAREIDIDILYYDHLIFESNELAIPHPFLIKRNFVLYPLNELAPEKKHPELGLSTSDLLKLCTDEESISQIPETASI